MSEKLIDIFPWSEHFFIGISLIDEQHQKLVDILNRLANHIAFESSKEELHTLFDELADYVNYHFKAEERIWDNYFANDDQLLGHKDDHHIFNEQLIALRQAIDIKPKHEILSSTLRFLTRWLVSHILESDMYMAFVVQFIQAGSTLEHAKSQAQDKIDHSVKDLVDFIKNIYDTLSGNTYHLVQQIHEHEVLVESLKQHQARIQEMQSYARLGYWDLPLDGQQAFWSNHVYQMFGLEKTTPAGSDALLEIMHRDDYDLFTQSIKHCANTGLEHNATYRIMRPKDGQLRWIECHGKLISDTAGKPIKISGYIQDITDARQQQQIISEKDKQLHFITNHVPVYLAYGDNNVRYKFVNKQYADLYGYQPSEMIGLRVRHVLGKKIYNEAKEPITRALAGEKVRYIRHQDTPPHELLISYVPDFDSNNEVIGFIASLVDISDRYEAERFERFYTSILELLTSERPLDFLLKEMINGLEKLYPDMICSINLLDKTGRYFESVIGPSLPDFYLTKIQGLETGLGIGSCGTAAATGKIAIAEDIQTHPYWADYKELAQSANIGSCWSHPIISNIEKIMGTFAIYHRGKHSPSTKDIEVIERSAHLASIAITNCQHRQQLQVAATAFESEQEGMMIADAEGKIIQVNKAFRQITGYSDEEILGAQPSKLSSGQHDKQFYADMWRAINDTGSWSGEIYNRRKSGEIYPEFLRISAVYDSEHKHVINYVATFSDMTSNKKAEESIERLAFYDPLTGLPNRRLTHDRLKQALSSSTRTHGFGFLLLLDIDKFKLVNDIHGHEFGDALLCQVVSRLQYCLREQDTLSRMGSDEFAIIIEKLSDDQVTAIENVNTVVEKILTTISQDFHIDAQLHTCTLSIGITMFYDQKIEFSELLQQVDIALVHAKNKGGNCYSYFDPKMQEIINYHQMLETELTNAIKAHELELYLQPQVAQTGQIVGAETLIRWNHPQLGLISPADFIPLAEETGLIIPLGEWIVNEGCRQLHQLQKQESGRALTLSINVSAKQFYQGEFSDVVKSAIKKNGINPSQLKLELTETILVTNVEQTISVMNELANLGIKFSMDDFGTGYSSLQYLNKLPLNQLKIDQSFVRDISSNTNNLMITRTILAMAKNLGLEVIAEGVETHEQLAILSAEGCTLFQGYLFSKPVTFNHFLGLLADPTIEV